MTSFKYEAEFNKLSSLTDARGNTTRYEYDARGNLAATIYPDHSAVRQASDANGAPESYINRRGQTIEYVHNAAGQLIRQTFEDGSLVDFTYDPRGNLQTAVDARGTTRFEYSAADRLTKVTYPEARSLSFEYDPAGRRTKLTTHDGAITNYLYDGAGRLAKLTDGNGSSIVTYDYFADGRLKRRVNGNLTYTTYEYDSAGQLVHLINFSPTGTINSRFDYAYDRNGRRTNVATRDGLWTYEYDAKGQLTHAVFASSNPQLQNQNLKYVYDEVGNRIRTIENSVTTEYIANNLNQYVAVGATTLSYDADGNLKSKSGVGDNVVYAFDSQNRLVSMVTPTTTRAFEYNAIGNRVASIQNGQRTDYLIDPGGLSDTLSVFRNGTLVERRVFGLGLTSSVSPAGETSYYDFDSNGSTAGITEESGNYASTFAYLPFGRNQTGSLPVATDFTYVGQYGVMDEGNGLIFMNARYYDVHTGRFVGTDPLELVSGDINYYRYAANDPVNNVDPTGLFTCWGPRNRCENLSSDDAAKLPLKEWPAYRHDQFFHWLNENFGFDYRIPTPISGPAQIAGIGLLVGCIGSPGLCRPTSDPPSPPAPPPGICDINMSCVTPPPPPPAICLPEPTCLPTGVHIPTAVDPNEKTGTVGYGEVNFVRVEPPLAYRIHFENEPSSTAPAQRVVILDQLDRDLDWTRLELTEIGFADHLIRIPRGREYFQTTVEMTQNNKTFEVQIEAGIHTDIGQVFLVFQSIDPTTSLPPDVLTGFLPPENGTGRGMGHFSYIIRAAPHVTTGTETRNVATITFDVNDAVATNQVNPRDPTRGTDPRKEAFNTIDAEAPTSMVSELPETTNSPGFAVSWSGSDSGSGVAWFDIWVSTDSGPFALWLDDTQLEQAMFQGISGHTYAFQSMATDNVGNVELAPPNPDAQIEIRSSKSIEISKSTLKERSSGATVGTLGIANPGVGQTFLFTVDDQRFETVGAILRLKAGQYFMVAQTPTVSIHVTATSSGAPPEVLSRSIALSVTANPRPWQNESLPPDTNADGLVVAIDALRIINLLNNPTILNSLGQLPIARPEDATLFYYDVSGDGFCTPNDVLRIINFLNNQGAEGETALLGVRSDATVNVLVVPWPTHYQNATQSLVTLSLAAADTSSHQRSPFSSCDIGSSRSICAAKCRSAGATDLDPNHLWPFCDDRDASAELNSILDDLATDVLSAVVLPISVERRPSASNPARAVRSS